MFAGRKVKDRIVSINEGIRLKDCIRMQQKLMNVRVRCVAADSIYANNANGKFCKIWDINILCTQGKGCKR